MRIRPSSPRNRRSIAAALALPLSAALVASLAVPAGAAPAPSESKNSKTKLDPAIRSSLRAVPTIEGPIPQNNSSYAYNTMKKAKQPYDVATKGYVEEEFFLSGTANVYDLKDGKVVVATKAVPYVNRILVRRPADRAKSSGVVLLDIYNASNGFDVEDHWRRLGDHTMANGDTYIGVTSKPINVDALKNFDPKRYAKLTWNLSGKPDPNRKPLIADPKNPTAFNPHQSIPGTEEGLAWDIITQTGNALRANPKQLLGGQKTSTLLLIGQSQSGIYLNTWTNHFHSLVAKARGKNLFDGYLNSVGARNERPIRQDGKGLAMVPASDAHDFDVPFITVTAEGDYTLFPPGTITAEKTPKNRRHWQVVGTPHTDLLSKEIMADAEILRSGRLPRVMDQAFIDALNPYPLEPAIIAAKSALVKWHEKGVPAAPSRAFAQKDGKLERDSLGNALGGLRYGLIDLPLATYSGASAPGSVFGSWKPISLADFTKRYGTREAYIAQLRKANRASIKAGYLTTDGAAQMEAVARKAMDRIGVDW